jgi:hypothetical protein
MAYLDKPSQELGPGAAIGYALEGTYSAIVVRSAVDPEGLHRQLSQRGPKVDVLRGYIDVDTINDTAGRYYDGRLVLHDGGRGLGPALPHRLAPETSVLVDIPTVGEAACLAQTLPQSEAERAPTFDPSQPVDKLVITPGDIAFWPRTSVYRAPMSPDMQPAYNFEHTTTAPVWYGPMLATAGVSWSFPLRRSNPMPPPTITP